MNDSSYIFDLTQDNFEQIVIEGSYDHPVLVDFWASWCQPCQMLMPLLAKLAGEYQGRFILGKLNTEENQSLAGQFGIRSIPNVKLFVNGREVDEFSGALPESAIRDFLNRHLPRESDSTVDAAMAAHGSGNSERALELLNQAHASDPGNTRIPLAIAQIHAAAGDFAEAEAILDSLPAEEQEGPEASALRSQLFFAKDAPPPEAVTQLENRLEQNDNDSEARYRLAMALVQSQHYEAAIEHLLTLMSKDPGYSDGAARKALLKIFELLGDDPLVTQARRRLFNMMH